MAVVRKVSFKKAGLKEDEPAEQASVSKKTNGKESGHKNEPFVKRGCYFCKSKTEPRHFDAVTLRKYLNDRGRIVSRMRSGTCAKHQRRVSCEIKRARHLALLPFSVRV